MPLFLRYIYDEHDMIGVLFGMWEEVVTTNFTLSSASTPYGERHVTLDSAWKAKILWPVRRDYSKSRRECHHTSPG